MTILGNVLFYILLFIYSCAAALPAVPIDAAKRMDFYSELPFPLHR